MAVDITSSIYGKANYDDDDDDDDDEDDADADADDDDDDDDDDDADFNVKVKSTTTQLGTGKACSAPQSHCRISCKSLLTDLSVWGSTIQTNGQLLGQLLLWASVTSLSGPHTNQSSILLVISKRQLG